MIVFLDRDGVINKDSGYTHVFSPELIFPDVQYLNYLNISKLFIVTNQSGIGRGYFSESQFHKFMDEMIYFLFEKLAVRVDDYFFCPHLPGDPSCVCRKPLPGLFCEARSRYNLNLSDSIVVGDKISDIVAGVDAGVSKAFLINRGSSNVVSDCGSFKSIDYNVISSLLEIRDFL